MRPCAFDICDGSGFTYDEETNTSRDCRCRPQIIARNRAHRLSAVIPNRYQDIGFERFPITMVEPRETVAVTQRFVNRLDEHLDAGRGLWFIGGVGTGKTALAMVVTKAALAAGRTAARYTLPGLLSEIGRSYEHGSTASLLDSLTAVDLLHIDDIGAERTNDWVLETFYVIVNARYEEKRAIIATTNLTDRDQLERQITPRTVSRLSEMCDELWVEGDDFRLGQRSVA
jgi:DNA replication protein DnaC